MPNWLDLTNAEADKIIKPTTDWLDKTTNKSNSSSSSNIKIIDNRKINPVTNKPLNLNRDLKTGNYDRSTIQDIVQAANKWQVDPYEALAVSLQETGLGKADTDGDLSHAKSYNLIDSGLSEQEINSMTPQQKEANRLTYALSDKLKYAQKLGYKDPASQIQAYNGYGKLYTDADKTYYNGENKSFYGVDVSKQPLDLKKNPAYGKTILALVDMLKSNKEINDMVTPFKFTSNSAPSTLTGGTYDVGTTGSKYNNGGWLKNNWLDII